MIDFFTNLFSSDFMPHGFCFLWNPEIIWLHAISDAVIAVSYFIIPLTLVYFVRRRRDLPFHWMFLLFGLFIFGCGATHVMEVWTLWHGTYRLAGIVKAITAGASVLTAGLLIHLMPRAIALPSPEQLRQANEGLAREVAERRRVEAELLQARAELEQRVRERTAELMKVQTELAHVTRVTTMGELAASIAHEVNQPLTAVMANTNACRRWLAAEPPNLLEARRTLDKILNDTQRTSEVAKRIRDLLKKRPPEAAPQDLNALLSEVLALVHGALTTNRIETLTELGERVPAVLGDRVQLQQVVLNLVMNGVEAMHDVAGPRQLVLSTRALETGQVALAVRDSGTGIDPGVLEQIFEPFFTTKPSGMGAACGRPPTRPAVRRSISRFRGSHEPGARDRIRGGRRCRRPGRHRQPAAHHRRAAEIVRLGPRVPGVPATRGALVRHPGCPHARSQRARLPAPARRGGVQDPRRVHDRARRHSDVGPRHQGRRDRIPDEAVSRPGPGRCRSAGAGGRPPAARRRRGHGRAAAAVCLAHPPRARGHGRCRRWAIEQADCR
jgi:signal transduction histidine kinase